MRNIIIVKPPRGTNVASMHARYLSERERNPNREEPESRPLFTHDRDGLKHTAAERYLAGGETAKSKPHDLMHLIISFNSHDRRELEKLERTAESPRPISDRLKAKQNKDKKSISDKDEISDRAEILQGQVDRDLPYVRAVRLMMNNIEERTEHSELRYALTVHRHTGRTHVHVLLRREHIDKITGEKIYFDKKGLPEEFVNGRDERGKARGGLIDRSLSDALDTMIPKRQRALTQDSQRQEPNQSDKQTPDKTDQFLTVEPDDQKLPQNRSQLLDSRNPRTATVNRDAKTEEERKAYDAVLRQRVTIILGSTPIDLAPRYSTTRKQADTDAPDRHRTTPSRASVSAFQSPAAASDQKLLKSQTDQLLTPTDQLLDQLLNFGHFSKAPDKAQNGEKENKFSAFAQSANYPVDQTPAARPVNIPIKQLVKLERPELVPLEEKQRNSQTRSR